MGGRIGLGGEIFSVKKKKRFILGLLRRDGGQDLEAIKSMVWRLSGAFFKEYSSLIMRIWVGF